MSGRVVKPQTLVWPIRGSQDGHPDMMSYARDWDVSHFFKIQGGAYENNSRDD